jgi:hypothetical protein
MGDFYGFRRRRWETPNGGASHQAEERARRRDALLNSNWLLLAVLFGSVTFFYLVLGGYLDIDLTASATSGRIESTRLIK